MPFYILELRQSKSMKTLVLFWHFRTTFFFVLPVTVFVCTWQWQGSDGCSRICLLACDGLDNFCLYFILGCCSNCYSIPSGSDLLSFICRLVFLSFFCRLIIATMQFFFSASINKAWVFESSTIMHLIRVQNLMKHIKLL